jgi:zinc and cadmium transporter
LTLVFIIAATLAGGIVSVLLAGMLSLSWLPRVADRALAFSAGTLLAVALTGVVPEAIELGMSPRNLGAVLLVSLLVFYLLEQGFHWLHGVAAVNSGPGTTRIVLVVFGDGLHNFVDGTLIAAAFLTDPVLGWTAALGVLVHELPQELADFIVLLHAGVSRGRALLLNAASGGATVLGGVAGYLLLEPLRAVIPFVITFSGASFIYIALSGFIPIMQTRPGRREALGQLALLLAGAALIWFIGHR